MPISDKKFSVINCQSVFFLITKKVEDTLGNTLSEKDDILRVEVARFESFFDNEYFLNLGTLCDSREGTRCNPVDKVKTRHIAIETITLRWFPVEPLVKLCFGQRSLNFCGLQQS